VSTKKYRQQGPFAPPALPSFTATYGPIRHPHASAPLPGVVGYRNGLAPRISPRGVEGFSSCFTCPCHRATVVYPAGVGRALQPDCARPCCLRQNSESSASGSRPFELQVLGFPHTCHPSYGGLAPTPAGFNSLLNTLAFIGHTEFLDLTRIGEDEPAGTERLAHYLTRAPIALERLKTAGPGDAARKPTVLAARIRTPGKPDRSGMRAQARVDWRGWEVLVGFATAPELGCGDGNYYPFHYPSTFWRRCATDVSLVAR